MTPFQPAYLKLHRQGELAKRATRAREHLAACDLCARRCGVDRIKRTGVCRTGSRARVASFGPHHGEENPLRGRYGSGTIFFSWCNLRCQYCQNHDISQTPAGKEVEPSRIAEIMLQLQAAGCHNINFVSPSHVIVPILEAVALAAERGLSIPLVYNTGGYDSPEALALLEGVIDIYMPDMKYADAEIGLRLSKVKNYPSVNRIAVKEMHRQVGDLILDKEGIAQRGLLVRHLILPENLAGTDSMLRFLAEEVSTNTYLNLMDQYRPVFRAHNYPPLDRSIHRAEYDQAVALAHKAGLHRLDSRISLFRLF